MSEVLFEKFEEPIIVTEDKLNKGDVILVEYGDYGNWVRVVIDTSEVDENEWVNNNGRYISNGTPYSGWGRASSKVKVIGKEITNDTM